MKGRGGSCAAGLPFALPERKWEEEGIALGFKHVAGLDEAGRGPLAGPVMAAAVVLPRGLVHPEITDSKLLTAKKRESLSDWIKEHALGWGTGAASPEEIDRINILQASLLAMARALQSLRLKADYLLIDGTYKIPLSFLVDPSNPGVESGDKNHEGARGPYGYDGVPYQRTVKQGDRLCPSIAAASILAKVARDRLMIDSDLLYPGYGFAAHKGYGSAAHLHALRAHGPSPIHRKSFKPVREFTEWKAGGQPPTRFLSTDR